MRVYACPACGDTGGQRTGDEAPGFLEQIEDLGLLQPSYEVRECATCGLLYKTHTLAAAELNRYYSKVDYRKWEIEGFYPTERALLRCLETLPAGAKILDYGCSTGRLLAKLASSYRCFGYEINARAAAVASRKGLYMLSASAFEGRSDKPFDAIVLADVFEHLDAPAFVLRSLVRLLRPGGLLMIATGDGDAAACRLDPAQFWYFRSIEHLVMLTQRHADWLCAQLPLRLSSWQVMSHYDSNVSERIKQYCRHFAYWQFRSGNALARVALRAMPYLRRAERWAVAPAFSASKDHVVAVFEKHSTAM